MTITLHPYFLYYWLFAIVFETIYVYVSFVKAKREWDTNVKFKEVRVFMETLVNNFMQIKLFWFKIKHPFTLFVIWLIFCIISPVLMISALFTLGKKAVGYKTELEKKAEQEKKDMQEAQKKAEEFKKKHGCYEHEYWMKHEGVYAKEDIIEPPIEPSEDNS